MNSLPSIFLGSLLSASALAQTSSPNIITVTFEITVNVEDGSSSGPQPFKNIGEFLIRNSLASAATVRACPGSTDTKGKLICKMECVVGVAESDRWIVPPRAPLGGSRYTTPPLQKISLTKCALRPEQWPRFTYVDAMASLRAAASGTSFFAFFSTIQNVDAVPTLTANLATFSSLGSGPNDAEKLKEIRRVTADLAHQAAEDRNLELAAKFNMYTFAATNAEIKSAVRMSSGEDAAKLIIVDSNSHTVFSNASKYKALINDRSAKGLQEVRAVNDLARLGRASPFELGTARVPQAPMQQVKNFGTLKE